QRTVEEFGRVDILVNNAAYQMTFDGLDSIPEDLLVHTFKTNISCSSSNQTRRSHPVTRGRLRTGTARRAGTACRAGT
ncbi:MAG: hypothetical protein ACRDP8_16540, partial [Actinopolymorphaceae bacterium]